MLYRLRLWWRRLRLFCGIVWRPVTGPAGTEVWTWRDHWDARIGVRTAWEVAAVIHDR